jgi:hypothetical protein
VPQICGFPGSQISTIPNLRRSYCSTSPFTDLRFSSKHYVAGSRSPESLANSHSTNLRDGAVGPCHATRKLPVLLSDPGRDSQKIIVLTHFILVHTAGHGEIPQFREKKKKTEGHAVSASTQSLFALLDRMCHVLRPSKERSKCNSP